MRERRLNDNETYQDLNTATKGRITNALADPSGSGVQISTCTTGHCKFHGGKGEGYKTNGFCSTCVNATNSLQISGNSTFTLPNGLQITIPANGNRSNDSVLMTIDQAPNVDWASLGLNQSELADKVMRFSVSVANMSVISLSTIGCKHNDSTSDLASCVKYGTITWKAIATTCAIYPCRKELRGKVTNGEFKETVISEAPFPMATVTGNLTYMGTPYLPCSINGAIFTRENVSLARTDDKNGTLVRDNGQLLRVPRVCAQQIDPNLMSAFKTYFPTITTANCSEQLSSTDENPKVECLNRATAQNSAYPMDFWWLNKIFNNGNATVNTIWDNFEAVAQAMTECLRLNPTPEPNKRHLIYGTPLQNTVCLEFDWPWLIFPASLVGLTTIALAMIIWTASDEDQVPIWKTSILPAIYGGSGVRDEGQKQIIATSLRELDTEADRDTAVIEQDGIAWHLRAKDGENGGRAIELSEFGSIPA